MAGVDEALIAKRAYEIWEIEGRPHGRDREHWLKAVEELSTTIVADPVVLKPVKAAAPKVAAPAKASVAPKPAAKPVEAVTAAPRTKIAAAKKK